MWIMIACGALLLAGLTAGVCWSTRPFSSPDLATALTAGEVARRYAWYSSITLTAGIAAGITVIGAGGRLAMRLLAVTAGDDAQGRITEAQEIVGEITLDGTIGFVIFNGIFGGVVFGALFLLVRRCLPAGRLGGTTYGLLLLLVLGSILDPLRGDNPDFEIVGPGWLAVVVFTLLAVGFGIAIGGLTARMSTWLPQPSTERRAILRYAGPALIAAVAFSVTGLVALFGVLTLLVTRWRPIVDAVRSPRWVIAGRVLLIALVLASLPNTIANVLDIAGR
jgi:hypothetical protein